VENSIYNQKIPLILDDKVNAIGEQFWLGVSQDFDQNSRITLLDEHDLGFARFQNFKNSENYPYSLDGGHTSDYGARILYRELKSADILRQKYRTLLE
jgi:hypothetical protein